MNLTKITAFLVIVMILVFAVTAVAAGLGWIGGSKSRSEEQDGFLFKGNMIKINREKEFDTSEKIEEIYIKTVSSNISLVPAAGTQLKASLTGQFTKNSRQTPELKAYKDGNKITIQVNEIKYDFFNFFNFFDNRQHMKLTVYIPQSYSGSLNIKSTSGSVDLPRLELDKLTCKTVSGSISSDLIHAHDIESKTISGSMNISAKCDSFEFSSTSGSFKAGVLETKTASLNTTSGSIKAQGFTGKLDGHSVSGSINIGLKYLEDDIYIKTLSGGVKINLPQSSEFYLDSVSTSGSISLSGFAIELEKKTRNSLVGTVGSGKNKITVKTSSGSLNIYR